AARGERSEAEPAGRRGARDGGGRRRHRDDGPNLQTIDSRTERSLRDRRRNGTARQLTEEAMMARGRVLRVSVAALAFLVLLPALCLAQTGIIAGVVKDTTGAVMPGVTVEAASPALIEKVRSVVTD